MAKSNVPSNKKNPSVLIITIIFALIGATCLLIGYRNSVLSWMKTFGIVILVLLSPVVVYLIYKKIICKIKDM